MGSRAVSRPFLATLAFAALAALLAACGSSPTPVSSGSASASSTNAPGSTGGTGAFACPGDAPAEDVAAAAGLIDAANLAENGTISPIQAIRFTPAGTLAACRRLSDGVGGDALWAAAWVYATGGTDPAPILPLLAYDDPTIRAIAAAGVASLGRPEGLDALTELISVDAGLRGSLPPVTVARYAAHTLSSLIDGAADSVGDVSTGTPEERSAATAAWTSWLEANRARVTFDPEAHLWQVR
ncbi:MAG TPA: hypothetical protein VEX41_07250 [Candidatus Eisenbacteria bacterium]|nr:hypothetical protein [Candidatus Eisenbacteria bacterium]